MIEYTPASPAFPKDAIGDIVRIQVKGSVLGVNQARPDAPWTPWDICTVWIAPSLPTPARNLRFFTDHRSAADGVLAFVKECVDEMLHRGAKLDLPWWEQHLESLCWPDRFKIVEDQIVAA